MSGSGGDPHAGARSTGNGSAWGGLSSSTPPGSASHGPGGLPASGTGSSSPSPGKDGGKVTGTNSWSRLGK